MRGSKWIPIAIIIILAVMGIGVGLTTIFPKNKNEKEGKPALKAESPSVIREIADDTPFLTGVLRSIDRDNGKISVYMLSEMKEEIFDFDNITSVKSYYGRESVMEELPLGSVVDMALREGGPMLDKIAVNKEAWDYKGVKNLEINDISFSMKIGERKYMYDSGITVISGAEQIKIQEIIPDKDILEVRGIGEKIVSISVTEGHGMLDFINYDEFLGGNIEVGYEVFDDISENMKFTLREGSYKVFMENGGLTVNKVVDIKRNRTEVLDIGYLAADMTRRSRVKFKLEPKTAELFIDGKGVNFSRAMSLDYGEYIVKASAEGYTDWERIITVSTPKSTINISLVPEKTEDEEKADKKDDGMDEPKREVKGGDSAADSENNEKNGINDNGSDETDNEDENDREIEVKVDNSRIISFRNPAGASVTFDGKEVGTVPCDITKVTGEHSVTISKPGYISQTYTVDIANDGEDAIFSFPELTEG